ncbi:MAG: hypothetical protein PVF58_04130 [Candidatus Methanofastidiosia archaeon]|jgi:hypothetical protein
MPTLDEHLKETIDLFHSLFLKRGNPEPENSAKYYVTYLLLGCGSTFTSLHNEIRRTYNLEGLQGRRDLENGREKLVEDGMLAKILFHHETDMEKRKEVKIFKNEQFLPANPMLVYEDISQRSQSQYKLLDNDYELLEQLNDIWKKNFNDHGFLIEKGILTVYCTVPWLLFNFLKYHSIRKKEEKILRIMTSNTKWYRTPFFSLLHSELQKGVQLKALLGSPMETKELKQLNQMNQVKIRSLSKEEVVTNELICAGHEYVVDMHKILGTKRTHSHYVATIYLGKNNIVEQFIASFETRWRNASLETML